MRFIKVPSMATREKRARRVFFFQGRKICNLEERSFGTLGKGERLIKTVFQMSYPALAMQSIYCQISNTRRTNIQNFLMFRVSSFSCLCPSYWCQLLGREWRCSWSCADRRCFNYIWVINDFIARWSVTYIRDLTVHVIELMDQFIAPRSMLCKSSMHLPCPSRLHSIVTGCV